LYCCYETPLEVAVEKDSEEIVELLINAGANVNISNGAAAWTPLHTAASRGRCDMMNMLIEGGANIEAQDINGATPLFKAWGNGLELLLAEGANVYAMNSSSSTPLMNAACRSEVKVVEMLLAHGVDVDTKDNRKFTALTHAVHAGDVKIVDMLLAHKADVDARDRRGFTPLMHLSYSNGIPLMQGRLMVIAEMLLKNGADIFAQAFDGQTAVGESHGGLRKLLRLEMDRQKFTAFAMSSNDRLGKNSQSSQLHKEMLRMIWELSHETGHADHTHP
jgi:ankyrin repeat protein